MQWSSNNIRSAFLDFFAGKGHTPLPSSPLVPHNDPTLMFTNAGMVQFKHVFSGAETLHGADKKPIHRAATSQKCVRAGGKHNDLDNVGYTARHHTFFEMLGNFSFGDYFKEEAILYAWELLTGTFGLSKDRLLVTVYHTDDEAFDLWKKISGFSDEKIIRIPTHDNFWAMGDTGPCGPCSEIFYDHGEQHAGGPPGSPDEDGDRFIEIWNLVFMQFEQLAAENGGEGKRINLPKPCIDTGMGLERIAAILQGKHDNYDTDVLTQLIRTSVDISGNSHKAHAASHRVIADHLRSSSFLIADGVLPSNEGRGYVLRRIMRRAMRHAHQLGCKEPLMYQLVPSLVHEMGATYSELVRAEALIIETLKLEEERFRETLGRGLKLLETETGSMKSGDTLQGEVAFRLYDTYGFPLDLTQDILRAKNIAVDTKGFDEAMNEQKKRARAAWSGSGESATESVWFDIQEKHGSTEFLGYDLTDASGKIVALIRDGKEVPQASEGEKVMLVTNQTPFYGESGGQLGDRGIIFSTDASAVITDTKKILGALHVHIGQVTVGTLRSGEEVTLKVDEQRRRRLRCNHSATHLLHAVLRRRLGDHITQKGSEVDEGSFRFDFSHPKKVSAEELREIEEEVNRLIRQNTAVSTRLMTPKEAVEQGAMALFGEKYGEEVRVLSMGTDDSGQDYSIELCGGTHVKRTGDIGLFKIIRESSVSAGVRRIEALSGEAAFTYTVGQDALITALAESLKASPEELAERIESLKDEKKKLETELSDMRKSLALGNTAGKTGTTESQPEEVGGIRFIGKTLPNLPPKDLRGIADNFKKELGSGVVAIIATNEGKASIVVGVTDDLIQKISAVELVKKGSEALGGKGGGGRPDFAQAGGPDAQQADNALHAIRTALETAA